VILTWTCRYRWAGGVHTIKFLDIELAQMLEVVKMLADRGVESSDWSVEIPFGIN
jgi:hypothetical protein